MSILVNAFLIIAGVCAVMGVGFVMTGLFEWFGQKAQESIDARRKPDTRIIIQVSGNLSSENIAKIYQRTKDAANTTIEVTALEGDEEE